MKKGITIMVGCVLAMLNLVGCQSNQYVSPQLTPGSAATLIGTNNTASGGVHAVPFEIDGKWLAAHGQREGEVLVSPGPHSINVLVSTKGNAMHGVVPISIVAQPATAYVIRASDAVAVTKECATSSVWIEKQNGEALTERVAISVVVPRGGTSYMVGGAYFNAPSRPISCHR